MFEFALSPAYFRYFLEGKTFEATTEGDFSRVRFAMCYRYYLKDLEIESRTFEKSNLLQNVRIPVGLFWGAKDGIVPFEIGGESKELLKNTMVTQVTFEHSWHEPFITETTEFVNAVRTFVGQ